MNIITQEYLNDSIKKGVAGHFESLKRPRQVHRSNWASELGHPCKRYLYYGRTEGDKATEFSAYTQGIFHTGNIVEREFYKLFLSVGEEMKPKMRIVGTQALVKDNCMDKANISGVSDGLLQIQNEENRWDSVARVDIKSSNPNIYQQLNTVDDLRKYFWTAKYIAQASLYSFADNLTEACIILVNKTNLADFKVIMWTLNFAYVEELINAAEMVNLSVVCSLPPVKINRPDVCGRCEYGHICLPDLKFGTETTKIDSPETLEMLERREELAPYRKEYESIERQLENMLVKGQNSVCGNYIIDWKPFTRKGFVVEASSGWKKKIINTVVEEIEE